MKQTAVEWLIEKLESHIMWTDKARGAFEQAKEMEKEQLKEAWIEGGGYSNLSEENDKILAQQYYNETFNKQ